MVSTLESTVQIMPSQTLKDKIVIITGGTGALGREVTRQFLEAGVKAFVPYIVDEEIELLKQDIGPSLISKVSLSKVDILQWPQVKAFVSSVVSKEDRIDVLVNLVGGYFGGPLVHETEERCQACGMSFRTREQLMEHSHLVHSGSKSGRTNYLKWAALGGFTGAIFMALLMIGAVYAAGTDGVAVVCSMGVALVGLQPTSAPTTTLGLAIHLVTGTVIGIVLATLAFSIGHQLKITSIRKGIGVGLLGGFGVFLVIGLPIMFYVMLPAMIQVMGMMSGGSNMVTSEQDARMMIGGMMVPLVAAWLFAHLVFGGIWGTITAYGSKGLGVFR